MTPIEKNPFLSIWKFSYSVRTAIRAIIKNSKLVHPIISLKHPRRRHPIVLNEIYTVTIMGIVPQKFTVVHYALYHVIALEY